MIIRCTDAERDRIKTKIKRSGLKQQDFLLKAALDAKIIDLASAKDLIQEIKRQGNNLNQIAHKLNANGCITDNVLIEIEEVRDTWQSLKQYIVMHL